jgi:sigma-B regulation protein RsbU (phosphoserine phosphatase)
MVAMSAVGELSVHDVLNAFNRDALNLFLGAAFAAAGIVSAGLAAIRKRDPLLIYFALFAALYGIRLWIKADLVQMEFGESTFSRHISSAIDFIIPLPAVLFFRAAGFLDRVSQVAAYILVAVSSCLALITLVLGQSRTLDVINNVFVIAALGLLAVRFATNRPADPDFLVTRRGLLIFIAFAFWGNVAGVINLQSPQVEPLGFVAFLCALGYVAARRTLRRDKQLGEIQKELEVARRIQLSILPSAFPESTSFHVAARYVPMTAVAGDFYDFIVGDDQQAGLLIADVSGHGVPAALIASMVKLAATSQRGNAANPSALLAGMNAALCGNTQNQFVTAAYVHLDSGSGELRYSAAGHPAMLLLRRDEVFPIEENGLMLAAFDFATYSTATHRLEPGDRLLLYTDGLVEAANARGDFFGHDALCAVLRQTSGVPPTSAADRIMISVQRWSAFQDDDLTVIVCDYAGSS